MRVVLDTNVIAAAFAARGLCAEVFEVCLTGHTLILSEHILAETEDILVRKIKLPKVTVRATVEYLRSIAEIVEPAAVAASICRDRNDVAIIGTAVGASADAIVTGDEDLLILKAYRDVKIMTPREFWSSLRGQ